MIREPVAVFGLGRSGLAVLAAATKLGLRTHLYDQADPRNLPKPELLAEALALGSGVTLNWSGSYSEPPGTVVVNPAIPNSHPWLADAVAAGADVIGEIEFAFQIAKAPIVAITGTNGKSTTTVMTMLALRQCGVDAVLCGNIFGSGYPEQSLTEAASNSSPDQVLVAEVSSFQLDSIKDFRPKVAGITNIWPDHLDRYPSFADYARAKHRIFENQTNQDWAVVRANDPVVCPPGKGASGYVSRGRRRTAPAAEDSTTPAVLTFGATGEHARIEDSDLFILNSRIPIETLPFQEPHNLQNGCMAALLACAALAATGRTPIGTLPDCIVDGLKTFHGLAHRMEYVGSKGGVRVINNSMCTNPDAVIKSVQAVRDPTHILMGGVNKSLDFAPLRHYLANHRHNLYLYGRDADELSKMLGGDMAQFQTMADAFHAAAKSAKTNEVVMLAPGCASSDSFRDFRERGDVFRELAKEWLAS